MAQRDSPPAFRQEGAEILRQLAPAERESFIISCWMSHDARWFMAAAMTFGLDAAMRLNRTAIQEEGRAEARRLVKRLNLPSVLTAEDYLLFQEVAIGLLGPDLLDYSTETAGDDGFDLRVNRCFAHENVTRAGIADQYECGIIPRLLGWLDQLGLEYELEPPLGKCLKAQGQDCAYAFRGMRPRAP